MNRLVLIVLAVCCATVLAGVSFADEPLDAQAGVQAETQTPETVSAPGTAPVSHQGAAEPAEAASSPAVDKVDQVEQVDESYRLMEEDILRMDVWGEPQLSNMQMQVTPDGKINVPYIGEIQAVDLTLTGLTEAIAEKLEEAEILINPKVQITLINMHQHMVKVMGEVRKPGVVVFKEGDTVLDAVAQAGSYTENAWLEKASLIRRDSGDPISVNIKEMLDGDYTNNLALKKGDLIVIPPEDYQNKIYVMGEVLRPSMYDLKDNTTVLSAVNLAGGPTDRASLRKTRVIRGDPDEPEIVACDLTKLLDGGDRSQDIQLQSGDVVLVPETGGPNWGKISQILGVLFNVSYLRNIGLF